jgi:hypothetical protein
MLRDFQITNFRTFSNLQIKRFGRVNLIVGKNNVGKTMLLEALRVYSVGASFAALRDLLVERDEFFTEQPQEATEDQVPLRIESLFHRKPDSKVRARKFAVGPLTDASKTVEVGITYLRRNERDGGEPAGYFQVQSDVPINDPAIVPGLEIKHGPQSYIVPYHHLITDPRRFVRFRTGGGPAFVMARGLSDREVARWWDVVALKEAEERVKKCLQVVAPVDRINFVEHPTLRHDRIAMVRLRGDSEPVPLKSLGDGMSRIFQIGLALECARPAMNSYESAGRPASRTAPGRGRRLLPVHR